MKPELETNPRETVSAEAGAGSPLWLRIGFWVSIAIAVAAVVRRVLVLPKPSSSAPPQQAELDSWFASHAALTYAHILCALVFVLILPLYFFAPPRIAAGARRVIYPIGAIVGLTAYAMSRYAVGGWTERSAVLLFDTYFLFSLLRAYLYSREAQAEAERRWLVRGIVVLLGIATARPVMGVFFATSRLTHLVPSQFFGIAFWIGWSINAITVELWLRSRSRRQSAPVLAYRH
jgi:hypothetical protein